MYKSISKFNNQSHVFSFFTKLFITLLISAAPLCVHASESAKLSVKQLATQLGAGVGIYFVSKVSNLKQASSLENMPLNSQSKDELQLVPIAANKQVNTKGLVDDMQGKKLVNLYVYNTHLSKTLENVCVGSITNSQSSFTLDSPGIAYKSPKLSSAADLRISKALSKISSWKGLISLLLVSSNIGSVSAGPYSCAVCVAGCCAALGQVEGPICVLHCATYPCAFWCLSPIP